jgi:proline iminopeptidase
MVGGEQWERVTATDGVSLAVRVVGAGERTLVVPSASWVAADLEPLAADRRVLFYDIRGRGRSDAVTDDLLGIERDVADLEALRAHFELERLDALGWSYHGLLAARYALDHPGRVERLVLVGSSAPRDGAYLDGLLENFMERLDPEGLREIDRLRRQGVKRSDPRAFCRTFQRVFFQAYVVDPAALNRMRADPCVEPNVDPELVNAQGLKLLRALGNYDWRAEFAALTAPTLILHGTEDAVPIGGSEDWAACLPNSELVPLPGVGHMPWLEDPRAFFPRVNDFLARD